MDKYASNLVWIDLEMTGLDISVDTILEVATVVTNNNLEIIAYGPQLVIQHNQEQLDAMNEWCIKQHGISGLTRAALASDINLLCAQQEILNFLKQYTQIHMSPLCGNSVWQDRIFLKKYMPEVESFLNYRIIDVSSIKEIIKRWYPEKKTHFKKPDNHRAQEDIIQSIEELKFYRQNFFLNLY